jgi:hypothetical protein
MTTYTVPKPEPPTPAPAAVVGVMPHEVESGALSALWILYLGLWSVLTLVGLLAIKSGASWAVIALFMVPLTLAGIGWRPMFGLALICLILPIGKAFTIGGVFTADRAIGIMFGLGAIINILVTRKRLHFLALPIVTLLGLVTIEWLSVFWAEYPQAVYPYAFTHIQMFFYILVIISIFQEEKDFRWPFLAFVVGCTLTVLLPGAMGSATEVGERLTIAYGESSAVNPNTFGVILGLGLLTAIYRYRLETSWLLRLLYLAAFCVLPVGVILTGSRRAAFSLAAAIVLPILFSPWALRRIRLILGLGLLLGLIALAVYVGGEYFLPPKTAQRLTDVEMVTESYYLRLGFAREAIAYVLQHPLGAGLGSFRTADGHVVHNDLFFVLSDLGFLGAGIFLTFAIIMAVSVMRMPSNFTKWYAVSVVAYQLLAGLGGNFVFSKHYWLFMAFAWLLGVFQQQAAAPITSKFVEPVPLNHLLTGPPQQPPRPVQGRWGS